MHAALRSLALGLLLLSITGTQAQTLSLPQDLVAVDSLQGQELLMASTARQDYFPLSNQFITQKNGAFCGVASSVMILNALGIPAPQAPEYGPYRTFTQENFFSPTAQTVLTGDQVSRGGMTLEQLGQLLATYPVQTKIYHQSDSSLEQFRALAQTNLKEPGNFVLINYSRKSLGQEGGGHISPLAAYNAQADRFLILDVSRYKYPPVWVKSDQLWQAMGGIDRASGKTRGFVVVQRP